MDLIIPLIILAIGSAISLKKPKAGIILSLIAIAIAFIPQAIPIMLILVCILNLATLTLMKNSYLKGVDYTLVTLMLFATFLALYVNSIAMLILSFIVVSTPTYMLIMSSDERARIDVGIKYITFMVIATVLFIIGSVLAVYSSINDLDTIYIISYFMMILGLALEVGIAPLHEWVPDVFDLADPVPVSIIASLSKFVPFIVVFKIIYTTFNGSYELIIFTALLSVISMFVGNIGALTTDNLSRILAYSTVANMGYVLSALTSIVNPSFIYLAFAGVLIQLFANSFGKIGLFTAIRDGKTSPIFSYLMALSFIGLPPLLGFWGKFYIVASLIYSNLLWVAILLVINSAISVPYYIRIASRLGIEKSLISGMSTYIVAISALIALITVIPPNWIVESARVLTKYFLLGGV